MRRCEDQSQTVVRLWMERKCAPCKQFDGAGDCFTRAQFDQTASWRQHTALLPKHGLQLLCQTKQSMVTLSVSILQDLFLKQCSLSRTLSLERTLFGPNIPK